MLNVLPPYLVKYVFKKLHSQELREQTAV